MNDAKQIDVHLGAPQHMESLHDLLVRGLLPFGDAVVIVQLLRPVETEPDVEIFLGEKLAPFFVDGRAVGLNAVDDLFVLGQMLLLQSTALRKNSTPSKVGSPPCQEKLTISPGVAWIC